MTLADMCRVRGLDLVVSRHIRPTTCAPTPYFGIRGEQPDAANLVWGWPTSMLEREEAACAGSERVSLLVKIPFPATHGICSGRRNETARTVTNSVSGILS